MNNHKIIFNNIRIINPVENLDEIFNLCISNGEILCISKDEISKKGEEVVFIDGSGMVACPGLLDMHVHLREPGNNLSETLQSGTDSAKNGGFTSVVCMPNTSPALDNSILLEHIISKSANYLTKVYCSAAITQGRKGELLTNMHSLALSGALYFTDDGNCVSNANLMKLAFEYAGYEDYLLAQHCEEHSLTHGFSMNESEISMKLGLIGYPSVAEEIIIDRDIRLSSYYRNNDGKSCRYHIQHISTAGSLSIVRIAKLKGLRVSCEVTPHHLWFDDSKLLNYDANYKMNPPLRKQEDITALIEGLKDGSIDCIASDHAPHSSSDCEKEFEKVPNGVVGLETSLGAILTLLHHKNNFSLNDIINLMSINPRKILGLSPIIIKEGAAANLTIFSPNKEWIVDKNKFRTLGRNTPFDKIKFIGKPEYTLNNNQLFRCEL